jgi:hypothetical protein
MSKLLTSIRYAASRIYPQNIDLSSSTTFKVIVIEYSLGKRSQYYKEH